MFPSKFVHRPFAHCVVSRPRSADPTPPQTPICQATRQNSLLKSLTGVLLLLALSSCTLRNYTLIQHVNVFDGEQVHENVNLVFADSLIVAITAKNRHYRRAQVIEGAGKTILPPLINAHVHVREGQNLGDALSVGVFALMDMFSTDQRANDLRTFNDSLAYAHFFSSNIGATVPGGHGTQFRVRIPTLSDSLSATQFVQDRLRAHADYLKLTQEYSMAKLSPEQVSEIVAETHRQGKIVLAHISDAQNGLELIRLGVDGLAHIWYRNASVLQPEDLALLRERKAFLIPTLSVIEKVIQQAADRNLAADYLSREALLNEVRKAHEAGVTLLAGTDSPNYGMDYGPQLFEELLLLHEAGLSNLEVLKSATTNVYEQFDLLEFGLLAADAPASFVLVDGQPHLNLADIKNPKRIWKEGVERVN